MIIRLRGAVVRDRQGVLRLGPVDLQLGRGLTGIAGHNGAGKSTLLKAICRIYQIPDANLHMELEGIRLTQLEARMSLGYVPQDIALYDDMTLQAYLAYIAGLKGIARERTDAEIERVCAAFGIERMLHRKLKHESVGYRRTAMIAQAFLGDPSFVMLDEPFVGLDMERRNELLAFLSDYAENAVVVVASHFVEQMATGFYDRMLVLKEGLLAGDYEAGDIEDGITAQFAKQ
ncbi:ATP-binding cassette domain-containing protein [Paenibacillus contaminans]|uniref:ABC transporter domain-containing protein n=1 Tax=Paenibacillus contaminans TaxID=450362 RepID=A0A329M9G8_9BACL|nr:ATP-binding cassette domain-containing protein [Paenibacillus contaminans]RAV16408.1 hypothetical protein DQG23_28760 [Paenibacillus contaminans]